MFTTWSIEQLTDVSRSPYRRPEPSQNSRFRSRCHPRKRRRLAELPRRGYSELNPLRSVSDHKSNTTTSSPAAAPRPQARRRLTAPRNILAALSSCDQIFTMPETSTCTLVAEGLAISLRASVFQHEASTSTRSPRVDRHRPYGCMGRLRRVAAVLRHRTPDDEVARTIQRDRGPSRKLPGETALAELDDAVTTPVADPCGRAKSRIPGQYGTTSGVSFGSRRPWRRPPRQPVSRRPRRGARSGPG